jgi:hypothetical protein
MTPPTQDDFATSEPTGLETHYLVLGRGSFIEKLRRRASGVAVLGLYFGRNFYTHFLYGSPEYGQIAANQSEC